MKSITSKMIWIITGLVISVAIIACLYMGTKIGFIQWDLAIPLPDKKLLSAISMWLAIVSLTFSMSALSQRRHS